MPKRPFFKLYLSLLCAYRSNKLPERGPTKARLYVLSITQLRAWAHRRSAYTQLSPLYLLSTLYVTHVIKYFKPSTAFPYCKRRKAGRGLGMRLSLLSAPAEALWCCPDRVLVKTNNDNSYWQTERCSDDRSSPSLYTSKVI